MYGTNLTCTGKSKMKFIVTMLSIFAFISCQSKIAIDENTNMPMYVGVGERKVFSSPVFAGWFDEEYSNYKIRENELMKVPGKLENITITIVMGTWCGDSRREVPRFYKILDSLKFPDEKISLIFVDRRKKGLEDEVEGLDIKFVPTIIFYKDDEEIGRIIETPDETLEEDVKSIVGQFPKYSGF